MPWKVSSWRSTGQTGWKDKARESPLVTEPLLREDSWKVAPFQPAKVQGFSRKEGVGRLGLALVQAQLGVLSDL